MGKYFKDETLDGLWTRLVASTIRLAGYDGWLTIGDIYPKDGYITVTHPSGDEFVYSDYEREDYVSTLPISITNLSQDTIYYVYSIGGYYLGKIFHKDKISWSVTEIHDILLSHYDLARGTTPITVGNYLKGISVAANYHTNNNEMDTATENTLAEIVDRLEHSCYLSDDMILTINGYVYEADVKLFDAETGEELTSTGPYSWNVYDLKDYFNSFYNGRRYYTIAYVTIQNYDEVEDLYSYVTYYLRSNVVECNFVEDYVFTLSNDLYLTGNREPDVSGDIYLALYRNNEPIGYILGAYGDVPYDFLNGEWSDSIPFFFSGNYYATISWYDHYGEYVTYTTDVVKFDGSNIEHWLFQDEYISTASRTLYDASGYPIVPVDDVSYTVFVDGNELGITEFTYEQTALADALIFPNDCCIVYNGGWCFFFDPHSGYNRDGGTVSIRINDPGMARVNITVENSGIYASNDQSFGSSLAINGVTYNAPAEITVPIGTNIGCSVSNNSGLTRSYHIYLNNVEVTYGTNDRYGASYTYTVKGDTDIILRSGATMGQYGPTGETTSISIVEL